MLYCSQCQTTKPTGQYCDQCGTKLIDENEFQRKDVSRSGLMVGSKYQTGASAAQWDTVIVRPNDVTQIDKMVFNVALVICPQCGRYNSLSHVFNCVGPCHRQHLCLEHFDAKHQRCQQCANENLLNTSLDSSGVKGARQLKGYWEHRSQQAEERLSQEVGRARGERVPGEKTVQPGLPRQNEQDWQTWKRRAESAEAELVQLRRQVLRSSSVLSASQDSISGSPTVVGLGIEMVEIKSGSFLFGANRQSRYLDTFYISRTPITNSQYKVFLEATDRRPPPHWQRRKVPTGEEHHPVTRVSWSQVQEFCAWLGVRLPSHQEWEKSARGPDGLLYPWGNAWVNGRCNSAESKIMHTTSVNQYLSGASQYGVLDMAGNVWEWCDGWADAKRHRRILCGGCFLSGKDHVRCDWHTKFSPGAQHITVGFRVAWSE